MIQNTHKHNKKQKKESTFILPFNLASSTSFSKAFRALLSASIAAVDLIASSSLTRISTDNSVTRCFSFFSRPLTSCKVFTHILVSTKADSSFFSLTSVRPKRECRVWECCPKKQHRCSRPPPIPVIVLYDVMSCTSCYEERLPCTVEYSTIQYGTANHNLAHHSTVQQSTVQHSIVQHSTGE